MSPAVGDEGRKRNKRHGHLRDLSKPLKLPKVPRAKLPKPNEAPYRITSVRRFPSVNIAILSLLYWEKKPRGYRLKEIIRLLRRRGWRVTDARAAMCLQELRRRGLIVVLYVKLWPPKPPSFGNISTWFHVLNAPASPEEALAPHEGAVAVCCTWLPPDPAETGEEALGHPQLHKEMHRAGHSRTP